MTTSKSASGKQVEHLRTVARVLADKYDIKVKFKGQECHTTGKVITLPIVPDDSPEDFINVVTGMMDHETGHIIYTQFDVWNKEFINPVTNKPIKADQTYRKHIWNALEDPRVEAKISAGWRGCKHNIEGIHTWAHEQLKEGWHAMQPFSKFVRALGCGAGTMTKGGRDQEFLDWIEVHDSATHKLYKRAESVLSEMRGFDLSSSLDCNGTARTLDLTKKVMKRMGIIDPDVEDEDGTGPDEDYGEGTEDGEGTDGDEENDGNPFFMDDSSWDDVENELNTNRMVKEYAKLVHTESNEYLPYDTSMDKIEVASDGSKSSYATFARQTEKVINTIRRELYMHLMSKNRVSFIRNQRRGRLDRRSIYKLQLPDGGDASSRVFRKRREKVALNTAVELCIDMSGSMTGGRIINAVKTAAVFGEVLDRLGIPFEILGHTTRGGSLYEWYDELPQADKDMYTRFDPLRMIVFKSYEDTWKAVRHRLDPGHVRAHRHNLDVDAFRYCIHRLSLRPEPRKVFFDIKDGYPQGAVGDKNAEWNYHLKKEVQEAMDKGFEIVGVGIQCTCVEEFYPDFIIVSEVADLATTSLRKLSTILRKGLR